MLNRLQDALAEAFVALGRVPLLDVNIVREQQLFTGVNTVSHGLDRPILGWLIVDRNSGAQIYRVRTPTEIPARNVVLQTSADVIVSILFF